MIDPIPKPAPVASDSMPDQTIGRLNRDAMPIYLHERVLEQILVYSEQDLRRELGGFLIGGFHQDRDESPYVEVREFLPAVDARSRGGSLTFTHETWSAMNRQVESEFPGLVPLGWHHTHPDLGVFLSGYDLFIHRHFFPHPWQIALVLDPVRHEFCFFQWRGDDVVDCGFVCISGDERTEGLLHVR